MPYSQYQQPPFHQRMVAGGGSGASDGHHFRPLGAGGIVPVSQAPAFGAGGFYGMPQPQWLPPSAPYPTVSFQLPRAPAAPTARPFYPGFSHSYEAQASPPPASRADLTPTGGEATKVLQAARMGAPRAAAMDPLFS